MASVRLGTTAYGRFQFECSLYERLANLSACNLCSEMLRPNVDALLSRSCESSVRGAMEGKTDGGWRVVVSQDPLICQLVYIWLSRCSARMTYINLWAPPPNDVALSRWHACDEQELRHREYIATTHLQVLSLQHIVSHTSTPSSHLDSHQTLSISNGDDRKHHQNFQRGRPRPIPMASPTRREPRLQCLGQSNN
jgi:hypothetical protein